MSTGQDKIDEIRDELQDTTDLSVEPAVLLRYLNRGAKEFCSVTGALQATANINTDNTNFKFTLSASTSNLVIVFAVEFNGIPLSPTFRHEITTKYGGESATPTNATGWYQFNKILYLEVIAPMATGADALTVFYLRTPTIMTSVGDTFDFPEEYEPAIVAYAIARVRYSDRDSILSSTEMGQYYASRDSAFAIMKNLLLGDTI